MYINTAGTEYGTETRLVRRGARTRHEGRQRMACSGSVDRRHGKGYSIALLPLPSTTPICSGPALLCPPSVPLLPRNEAAVATHRCGRRLLRNHPLGIDFEALFFFFLLMEFGILEGVRCKLLSFRDRFERDWRM